MDKKTLRQQYIEKRKQLSNSERNDLSEKIFELIKANFELEGKKISVFIPIERFNEVNTWELINNVKADYYLPLMVNDQLKHLKYESIAQLKLNSWGILEPTHGTEIEPVHFDIVIVPLLVIDSNGNRVGYGKGFYDGFLKDCSQKCKFIGVSFFEPISQIDDVFEADIPLHYCATPNKMYSFK
ncbi:5-formyltetrahydrofolate cyclo-ligase [Paracrocinitomix mangrovi]|uniref:5-formyltetrahydrofolate cyclo-ligase n=1 Tax=Paracrocinitomix mangrovi TaxID=2862509 RepID=UPI001C8EE577|nr:5-formyltetrahydrofolate cyclo-ligase [Paracrocinitomix mangrovi]UKN01682.1 5-formyltetrahydrofolate cyclo-ligase [Paracrocinitomix mangrovi]